MPISIARSRIGLAAVTLHPSGGGIAYVSRLVWHALREQREHDPWLAALNPSRYMETTRRERLAFAARVLAAQTLGDVDALVYTHHHLAAIQQVVPTRWRCPYAVFLHDRGAWSPNMARRRRVALKKATVRLAISERTRRLVLREYPEFAPLAVCHLALLPDHISDGGLIDHAALDRVSPQSVAIIGRMWSADRYKGHDELLECWREIGDAVPGAQLVIVGDGDDRERLARKASCLGLESSVIFLGFISDATLQAILRRVAVFAMPSTDEGFGLVFLEAMRAGLPCIAGIGDAAEEVVVHGTTGLLVDRQDRNALVRSVVGLLTDPELRRCMGRAGRARYHAQFTFERFRDRLTTSLNELALTPA